jgi:hypothetical protein
MTDGRGDLDRLLAEQRDVFDAEIARSGAVDRVRDTVLAHRAADSLFVLHWQRIAAAVLIAGMLGGAVGLLLPERRADPVDVAIVDLYDMDQPGSP